LGGKGKAEAWPPHPSIPIEKRRAANAWRVTTVQARRGVLGPGAYDRISDFEPATQGPRQPMANHDGNGSTWPPGPGESTGKHQHTPLGGDRGGPAPIPHWAGGATGTLSNERTFSVIWAGPRYWAAGAGISQGAAKQNRLQCGGITKIYPRLLRGGGGLNFKRTISPGAVQNASGPGFLGIHEERTREGFAQGSTQGQNPIPSWLSIRESGPSGHGEP